MEILVVIHQGLVHCVRNVISIIQRGKANLFRVDKNA